MSGYFGSKAGAGVKERIISLMPPHDTYIELFLGSGVILNYKPPSSHQIGIEKNQETIVKCDYPEGAEIINDCAFAFMASEMRHPSPRTLIYADPPYVAETRKGGGEYGEYEMNDDEHVLLIEELKRLADGGVSVMLSGYRSKLYDDLLEGWRRIDYQTMTHSGVVTESLWLSYDECEPYWHKYAGNNKAERQQIKRKAERWASNYHKCTKGERLAIMAALLKGSRD